MTRIACVISNSIMAVITLHPSLVTAEEPKEAFQDKSDVLAARDIQKILVDEIDIQKRSLGMVVGIIGPEGRHTIAYGRLDHGDSRKLDGDTVFEVCSLTKVFTSLLLADMVRRGEVALGDPIAKYLPAGVKLPERNGKSIALVDLATDTSGLPFMPFDFPPSEEFGSAARYSEQQLFAFLATYELPRDIGSQWEYSNLGTGLLGRALAQRASTNFEELLRTRVTAPLGLKSTAITVSPEMRARLAVGHGLSLEPTPSMDVPASPAAGSLYSTANDLLTFLAACMGLEPTPLASSMSAMLETRRRREPNNIDQALGWFVRGKSDDELIASSGGTYGYGCAVLFDRKARTGVVLVSNTRGIQELTAAHVLRPKTNPLVEFPRASASNRQPIAIDAKLFDLYAGKYSPSLAPLQGQIYLVRREGDALRIVFPNAPKLRLWPETKTEFFIKENADLRIKFEADEKGRVTGLIFQTGAIDIPAKRLN
jgi:CubicO group peptidase (beta-lactamase class C family)